MTILTSVETVTAIVSLVGLLELVLLWRILRAARAWGRVEERVAHFGKVLTLLTETNETGFTAIAAEIARANDDAPTAAPPRATNRSVAAALRGGRSSRQVAADRDISEGEVMLRGYLGGHAVACPCATCAEQAGPHRRAARSG